MNIDIVLYYGQGRGGLEKVIETTYSELEKRGHCVRVIQAFRPFYKEWEQNIEKFYFLFDGEYDANKDAFLFADRYNKYIKKYGEPDVILATHTPILSYLCKLSFSNALERNIPIISWLHGPPNIFPNGELVNFADSHLAICKEIEEQLNDISGEKRVELIYNPLEFKGENIKRKKDVLEILFVGRLSREKRVDILLKSLNKLEGDWILTVVGDGELKGELINQAEILGIGKKIRWIGWHEKPWEIVESASVMVMTSDYEGFGLVGVEALSRGIPVITTRTEGPKSYINSKNGWIVDCGDYKSIRKILKQILEGEVTLPNQEECISSIQMYRKESVIAKMEKILLIEWIRRKNMRRI